MSSMYPTAMYRRNEAKKNGYDAVQAKDAGHKAHLEDQGWVETPAEAVEQEPTDERDRVIADLKTQIDQMQAQAAEDMSAKKAPAKKAS